MTLKLLKTALVGLVLLVSGIANAALISVETTGSSDNGQRGIMFNVDVGSSAISLAEISTFFYNETTADYEFYYIEGGLLGNENTPSAWTLHDSVTDFTGQTTQLTWDFIDLLLSANTTYGLYFTNTSGGGIGYGDSASFGQEIGSDSNLTIYSGYGRSYAFDLTFDARELAGSLSYELVASEVPEPSTLALFAIGLLGLASRRFKK